MEPMKDTSSSMALDAPSWSSRNSSLRTNTVSASNKLLTDDNSVILGRLKAGEHHRPFASFGSFQQRHGNIHQVINPTGVAEKPGKSIEAPAILKNPSKNVDDNDFFERAGAKDSAFSGKSAKRIERDYAKGSRHEKDLSKMTSRLKNVNLEEAWERRKCLHWSKETSHILEDNQEIGKTVGRSVSDCGDRRLLSQSPTAPLSRKRSLTDDDLEELRGCIDLGFSFYNDEAKRELWSTLPALELCYAISQNLKEIETIFTPPPNLPSGGYSLDGAGSPSSSPLPSWRISSPGDHPQQVKARLKHWAQAVAFTVKQNL